jgi:LysR family glycine cleavage system transcriptional activator
MSSLHRRISDLLVFAAAAQSGTFSAAGRELGITQTAVSHRMAKLEHELGLMLFTREWRGVKPTAAGQLLLGSVLRGAQTIEAGLNDILQTAANDRSITIVTDFGFASFWLLPRLDKLRATIPDVDVRLLTTRSSAVGELARGDIALAFNAVPPDGWQTVTLVEEVIVPVASPGMIAQGGFDLRSVPLLHLDVPEEGRWSGWTGYFEDAELAAAHGERRLTFNNYPLLIQAAIAGQGVALGWMPLVHDLVARKMLAEAGPPKRTGSRGYDLLFPRSRAAVPAIKAICDWMLTEAYG